MPANSLGTVTIDVQARTAGAETNIRKLRRVQSGWVTDMRKIAPVTTTVARGMDVIEKELAQLKVAYRTGSISVQEFRTQQGLLRKELMGFNLAGNTQQLNRMNTMLVATAPAANKARQGLGTLRSAGASLTSRMVGLNGTIGTFVGAIGQFAVGSLATVGIIGGIAAIAFGFKKIAGAARKAKQDAEAFRDSLIQTAGIARATPHEEFAAEKLSLTQLREQVRLLTEERAGQRRGARLPAEGNIFIVSPARFAELTAKIAEVNSGIQSVRRKLEEMVPPLNLDPLEKLAELLAAVQTSLDKIHFIPGAGDNLARVTRGVVPITPQAPVVETRAPTFPAGFTRPLPIPLPIIPDIVKLFDPLEEALNAVGRNAIRSLIEGMLSGFKDQNLGNLLANSALSFISTFLTGKITLLLGIASPSKLAREWGHNVIEGFSLGLMDAPRLSLPNPATGAIGRLTAAALTPATANINLNTNGLPPAMNPTVAARDRLWLNLIGETNRVLKTHGG